ncbi:hypothetical protein [Ekhidna sp.]|uniref:hypothetical protein n=1 Tax=Ekhidna sp. TaxID=2608089 RepID=UPI003BA9871E
MTLFEEGIKKQVLDLLEKHYIKSIKNQLGDELEQMHLIVEAVDAFHHLPVEQRDAPVKLAEYKTQLYSLIEAMWGKPEKGNFSQIYDTLIQTFPPVFEALPSSKFKVQDRERFYAQQGDSTVTKVLKLIKRIAFTFMNAPLHLSNKLKKKKQAIPYWKHKVPVRNLAKYHFQTNLIESLCIVTDLFFTTICEAYLSIKIWEEELMHEDMPKTENLEEIRKKLKGLKASFSRKAKSLLSVMLDERLAQYEEDGQKAGTIEFSNKILSNASLDDQFEKADKRWSDNNLEWKNTLYALFEEWRSDLNIYTLKYQTVSEFENFKAAQIKKLLEQIDPEIEAVKLFINESRVSVRNSSQDDFSKEIKKVGYQALKKLDKELLPRLSDTLTNRSVANAINKLEVGIQGHVEELSDEHVIVKNWSYKSPTKSDELKKISPYELISFEALSIFKDEIESVKTELFSVLESANIDIQDVGQIISFTTDSAISLIEEKQNSTDEALQVVEEGLQRAYNRIDKARLELEQAMQANSEKLEIIIDAFCNRLMELTINENVGELRLRIVRAKAAKQADEIKEEIREKIRSRKRFVSGLLSKSYSSAFQFLTNVSERFVLTASKPTITRQVSDFLLESQHAINSLPLIYMRLYRIEPLEDLELFEGRKEETRLLNEAFHNWNEGRYAGTTIIGEKWGGLTSFINYTIHQSNFPYLVTRFSSKQNIYDESGLIQLMREVFQNESFENPDQVVDYLNNGPKRVIILEDLQNLYLRKIGGFMALQLLFQLISRTHNNIFWITTTTIYSWRYLCKAIQINEFFSYVIEMGDLTEEQIVNIIWKRNRISGYNIKFEANKEFQEDKKFLQLDEKGQQQLLKDAFFTSLNSFAKSNVSLALIFWLLSTKNVDKNTITIGSFKSPDLNFISVLSMEKVYTLHALIQHDGLTEGQLQEILHLPTSKARLNLLALLQDGIITRKEQVYLVNPMVYRDTIAMLKSKNLIH